MAFSNGPPSNLLTGTRAGLDSPTSPKSRKQKRSPLTDGQTPREPVLSIDGQTKSLPPFVWDDTVCLLGFDNNDEREREREKDHHPRLSCRHTQSPQPRAVYLSLLFVCGTTQCASWVLTTTTTERERDNHPLLSCRHRITTTKSRVSLSIHLD